MAEEIEKVEIMQGAEYTRSTETVINEKGTTLSEYKTSLTAVDNHEAPSEVDAHSGGGERDGMEHYEDTMREAKEVEEELGRCLRRIAHDDIAYTKRRIEKGEAAVTNDPSLRKAVIGFSPRDTLVHGDNLEWLLSEDARLKGLLAHEEQQPLSKVEMWGYQGAISALCWLLGHHNEDLVAYLVSDRFELVMATPEISATPEGGVEKSEEVSNNARRPQGAASSAISRSRKEIERHLVRLLNLRALMHYKVLKLELKEGRAVISTDPKLKESRLCKSGDILLAHADYWERLERMAKHAQTNLLKKRSDELPMDLLQEGRVHGGICALYWFLSGENTGLATSLNFAVEKTRRGVTMRA